MPHTSYPVRLTRDEAGRYLATCRDVPEALTDGATQEDARREMGDALGAALEGYVMDGRSIPEPSPARDGETVVRVDVD